MIKLPQERTERPRNPLKVVILSSQDLGSDANISEENKTDDEKLTEAGLAVAVVGVVTDIITDDMKHDMAGRLALLNISHSIRLFLKSYFLQGNTSHR